MIPRIDRTVFDITLTWDRTRFHAAHAKFRRARKLIAVSITVQMEKHLKVICAENTQIEKMITETDENLAKHQRKLQIFEDLRDIAAHSVSNHFNKRMEKIRSVVEEQHHTVQQLLHEEKEYWDDIYAAVTSTDFSPLHRDPDPPESLECDLLSPVKEEWPQIVLSPEKSNQTFPSVAATFVIKSDESFDQPTSPYVPTGEREVLPVYSQPNYPPQLYFSPTILQDEHSEPLRDILSLNDQNQSLSDSYDAIIPIQRITRTCLLQYFDEDDISRFETRSNHKQPGNRYRNISELAHRPRTRSTATQETSLFVATQRRQPKHGQIEKPTIVLRERNTLTTVEADSNKRRHTKTSKGKASSLPAVDHSQRYSIRFSSRIRRPQNFLPVSVHVESVDYEPENSQSRFRQQKKSAKR